MTSHSLQAFPADFYHLASARVDDMWDYSGLENTFDGARPPPLVVSHKNESVDSSDSQDSILVLTNHTTVFPVTNAAQPVSMIKDIAVEKKGKVNKPANANHTTVVPVTNATKPVSVIKDIAVDKNREQLDKLSDILVNFPQTNPFTDFTFLDPLNPDHVSYSLPPYMKIYLQNLLLRLNDSPSSLAVKLQPFIMFDTTSNEYIAIDQNLNLITLQKLDFLMNKDKEPNFLAKAFNSLKKKRTQSN